MLQSIIFNDEKILKKDFYKIPKNISKIIFSKLDSLSKNWLEQPQIKKLNNYHLCDYRLRVWDHRILFNLDEEKSELIVFRVLHRSKLY